MKQLILYTTAYWKLTCSVKNKKNLLRVVYPGPLLIAPKWTFFCKKLFDTNLFFCAGPSAICCSRECGRSQSGEQSSEGQTVPLGCRSRWEMLTRNLTTICCVCILQSNSWFIKGSFLVWLIFQDYYKKKVFFSCKIPHIIYPQLEKMVILHKVLVTTGNVFFPVLCPVLVSLCKLISDRSGTLCALLLL